MSVYNSYTDEIEVIDRDALERALNLHEWRIDIELYISGDRNPIRFVETRLRPEESRRETEVCRMHHSNHCFGRETHS